MLHTPSVLGDSLPSVYSPSLAEQSRRKRRPLDACEMSDDEDGFVIDLGTGTGVSISSLELMDVPDRQSTDGRRR